MTKNGRGLVKEITTTLLYVTNLLMENVEVIMEQKYLDLIQDQIHFVQMEW